MFYYLPIESLDERYTVQWRMWIPQAITARGHACWTIDGTRPLSSETDGGQFLNWSSTIAYKSSQLVEVARLFHEDRVHDGDVFFVADIWFPGIEAIAYMADLLRIDVRLYGVNHAGPFDPTDLVRSLLPWGQYQEAAWYALFDGVFVGSEYLASLIQAGLCDAGLPPAPLYVTGLPVDDEAVRRMTDPFTWDQPTILWPHRLSPDKNVDQLYDVVEMVQPRYPDLQWVITSGRAAQTYQPKHPAVRFLSGVSKAQYYGMLRAATLMLSTAYHENFGYTVREATALGTPILCPRRACYPEMILSPTNLYTDTAEAAAKIMWALDGHMPLADLKPSGGLAAMLDIIEQDGR